MLTVKWISIGFSAVAALMLLALMTLTFPAKSADAAMVTSGGDTVSTHQAALLPTDSVMGDTAVLPEAGNADLLATENILTPEPVALDPRERVLRALERDDIRADLQSYGVSQAEARARVASLTDSEVAELANELDNMPAGAGTKHNGHHHGGYIHDSTFAKLLVIGAAGVLFPPSLMNRTSMPGGAN